MKSDLYKKLAYIQKNLKAPKGQRNNFGNYDYRSCEDILESVKPLLDGLSLTISDTIEQVGDRYYVKATASLTDGEDFVANQAYAREEETKKGMDGSQITGAASSYARKYALNGLFAIDDERDADTKDNRPAKPVAAAPRPAPASGLTKPCQIHNVQMTEHISKTGKPYFGHKMEDGKWCFGR
jgi:hypothetical protein